MWSLVNNINSLLDEPWIEVLLVLATFAAGMVVTTVYYRRSQIGRRLSYHFVHKKLLGYPQQELPSELEIVFKGNRIRRLEKTLLMLWNSGNQTIHGSDIVTEDKLSIILPKTKILSATVIKRSRDVNKAAGEMAEERQNEINITFDFLDKSDGMVVELLYERDAENTGNADLDIQGTVKGMPSGSQNLSGKFPASWPLRLFWFLSFIGGLVISTSRISDLVLKWSGVGAFLGDLFGLGFGILLGMAGARLLWQHRRRFPVALAMDEFRVS